MKYRIFISSVQTEFEEERRKLRTYIESDVLLSSFFECFVFERTAAADNTPREIYSKEIEESAIYLGLLGNRYGFEDDEGISATEREFDYATEKHLERWVYIYDANTLEREPKETDFINKAVRSLSRKRFTSFENLKQEVYKSCITFLKIKGKINSTDFDQSVKEGTSLADVDTELVQTFVTQARAKRNFPLKPDAAITDILTHLNLYREGNLVNSALLLFNNNPQQYFPAATIKCAQFHGTVVQKPIPDYKEYKGTIYQQIENAVDFVLSKISLSTGTRSQSNHVATNYEVPRAAISEAIINAVAHRDYTSKASIQLTVFKDRIEIANPGHLPKELNVAALHKAHRSYPHNPNLADCLFQTGTIDRYGTGTIEIYKLAKDYGLNEPKYAIDEGVKVTLWRPSASTGQVTGQVTGQATGQVQPIYSNFSPIERVILTINGEMKSAEIQAKLELSHRETFRDNYLNPALQNNLVEMTIPDKPKSPKQKYRLTPKGLAKKNELLKQ
mgnify:CR=1 FL=1